MIIQFYPQAASEVRSRRSESSSIQTARAAHDNAKVIQFPGSEMSPSGAAFKPARKNPDSIMPFKPTRQAAGQSKGRFKLMVFKPGRYERADDETRRKIIDTGLGGIPLDYFPEAA